MTMTADAARIFADARVMLDAALRQWDAGDVRDAAEKAWCAAKRATDALILARTGEEPPKSPDTTRGIQDLAVADDKVSLLHDRYFARQTVLHGHVFYTGIILSLTNIERLIRETAEYIADAERLADA